MGEGAGGALRELLAVLDISVDTKELEEGSKKLEGFKDKILAAGKFVAEAFAVDAIKEFVEEQVEVATHLEQTAQKLGLTTEQVEKFDLAARLSGVSTDAMNIGLRFLSRNMGEAETKGGSAGAAFTRLGVHLKEGGKNREMGAVLEDIAEKFQGIQDPAKKTQIATELFGRQGAALIPILNKGKEAFVEAAEAMEEFGGPTTKETIASAKLLEEQQVKLAYGWNNLKTSLATALFPVFGKFVEMAEAIVKGLIDVDKHTNALQSALVILGGVAVYKAITGLGTLAKTFGLLKPSILETIAALWEFAAPAILIGVLFLAFSDLYALMKGNKSVIGAALDEFLGIGAATTAALVLNGAFEDTLRIFSDFGSILWSIVWPAVTAVWHGISGIYQWLDKMLQLKPGEAGGAIEKMLEDLKGDSANATKGVSKAAGDLVGGPAMHLGAGGTLDVLTKAGISPEMLLRGQNLKVPPPVKGHVPAPAGEAGEDPKKKKNEPSVVQHMRFDLQVHTRDKPEHIAKAIGAAATEGIDKANAKAGLKKT